MTAAKGPTKTERSETIEVRAKNESTAKVGAIYFS